MKSFNNLLINTLIANVTNSFLWFCLTFWAYLETQNVMATAFIGGAFMILSSFSGLFFGSFVDHHRKKYAMQFSAAITLVSFLLAFILFFSVPESTLLELHGFYFWLLSFFILCGAVAGNMRGIALSTLVTILIDEDKRDKANGMVGTVNGIAFAITSVFSGLVIGFLGMGWAVAISVILTFISFIHLYFIHIEKDVVNKSTESYGKQMDLKGTIEIIKSVPGLVGLIVFTTFNNLLGGVFMALMDPYGLSLVSVQTWGIMWGVLSSAFIVGGIFVAKKGIGSTPVRTLFIMNIFMWFVCIFFTVRPIIALTAVGMYIYMLLIPVIEAIEQTVVQKIVPVDRQGRVFGFAHTVETAASPLTAFLIGPLTQYVFIPFMTTGIGVELLGPYLGYGPGRGIALVFSVTGLIGLLITIFAMRSRTAINLARSYKGE
ncbi:MAG: transporter, family, multidrug efflux protein [Patescibacteria group bacterium]|nr:transporter, family, multidrug efflux protein [Patescibacteria group bacterium]